MAGESGEGEARRVLIVDDHQIMRQGLRLLIEEEPDLAVCGEAEDRAGALKAMEAGDCDAALVDITLKEDSGLELIKDIKVRWPKLPILVLSMHSEAFYAERCLRAGAQGYVTKAEAAAKVIEGLRAVLAGKVYVSDDVASKMLTKLVAGGGGLKQFPIDRLSDRELEVLELVGRGLQTREVAEALHLSVKTVDAHREHIKKKLGLDSATELLTYAVRWVQFEHGS